MKSAAILTHDLASLPGGPWGFVVLVLLILFVTLVATEGSKRKDK
ncbi:MAG: hypothetical protein ABSH48_09220 [Verrucomicrobiota bacterium]|jgi:hypothetical protein